MADIGKVFIDKFGFSFSLDGVYYQIRVKKNEEYCFIFTYWREKQPQETLQEIAKRYKKMSRLQKAKYHVSIRDSQENNLVLKQVVLSMKDFRRLVIKAIKEKSNASEHRE